MELHNWNHGKPSLRYEVAPISARPLKERLERCKDELVFIHGMETFLQLDPKLGKDLLKDLSPEELTTKVMSTRRRPGKNFIEFSVNPSGEFIPDPKTLEEIEDEKEEIVIEEIRKS